MNVLLIGSGGREHALAWKIVGSPRVERLYLAPGNGGTAYLGSKAANVAIGAEDIDGLLAFAEGDRIDLTIVGPEVPLAAGIVDRFTERGLPAFGPTQAATRLESDKGYAKRFMQRHLIPTARFAIFTDFAAALDHIYQVDYPVVVKACGLAAGKGVIVTDGRREAEAALRQVMVERAFGDAGDSVVIEERLSGPEVSVLAFVDGETVRLMPPAQDHKRAYDGDQGPNTGGMGAYAPAPVATEALLEGVRRTILQPAVDGLRGEGIRYVGVLYAGLMLTDEGPKVLEFNARFGDPETQVILPLLESDLVDIVQACLDRRLARAQIHWRAASAASVVLASGGYPGTYEKGRPIKGLDRLIGVPDLFVFHAGTREADGRILTNGGRVLNVTAVGDDLEAAIERAYDAVAQIHFEGVYYRHDIGAQGLRLEEKHEA